MVLLATQITAALVARMQECISANGYDSDVGQSVFAGQLHGGAVQCPCIYVIPGRATRTDAYSGISEYTRTYDVRGFADANLYPGVSDCGLVDLIAWDLRRCLDAGEDTLGGLARQIRIGSETPGYRDGGGTTVGASLTVEIDYAVALTAPSTPA